MLCSMRWGLFFFFGGMCVIMTITVYLFYPETKGLGIEETPNVFKKHWCAQLQSCSMCLKLGCTQWQVPFEHLPLLDERSKHQAPALRMHAVAMALCPAR